jgi:transposase-like protein
MNYRKSSIKQSIPKELRYTITDFNRQFPDDAACLEHLKEQRFPGGIAHCEKCKTERKHYRINGRPVYSCDHCGTQISPMAGTIFEHSSTSLRLWYYAMYLMASTRCGISAKQIQRETGVTYKTAWRMFRQIRSLLSEPEMQLEGSAVEVDEMYYGGRRKRGAGRLLRADRDQKTIVVGAVERKGRVVARVVPDSTRETLHGIVKEYVLPSSVVFTDEHQSYTGLEEIPGRNYHHLRIKHEAKVYVMGQVHTQTIEGFWSLVKRGIGGVYHSVSQKYLQTYLNEYSFRYNRRDQGNLIFTSILKRVAELAALPASRDRGMTPAIPEPF